MLVPALQGLAGSTEQRLNSNMYLWGRGGSGGRPSPPAAHKMLWLRGCGIEAEGVAALAPAIAGLTRLELLALSNNLLGAVNGTYMGRSLVVARSSRQGHS